MHRPTHQPNPSTSPEVVQFHLELWALISRMRHSHSAPLAGFCEVAITSESPLFRAFADSVQELLDKMHAAREKRVSESR